MIRARGRRMLTCHHEAGHALVRWYFGHRTDRIVVLSVEDVRAGVTVENRRGQPVRCEGMVDGYDICQPPFGPIKLPNGAPEEQAEFDRLRAIARDIELINCLAGFFAEARYRKKSAAGCMFDGGSGDMAHYRQVLDAWPLGEDERTLISAAAEARAAALVGSPSGQAAIKALSIVLMMRGEASGDEAAALFRPAYGGCECDFGAWSRHWPPTPAQIRAGFIPQALPRRVAA